MSSRFDEANQCVWDPTRSEVVSECIEYAATLGSVLIAHTSQPAEDSVKLAVEEWMDALGRWGADYESRATDASPPGILLYDDTHR